MLKRGEKHPSFLGAFGHSIEGNGHASRYVRGVEDGFFPVGGDRDSGSWRDEYQDAPRQVSQDGDSRDTGQFGPVSCEDSAERPVHMLRRVSRWREVRYEARVGDEEVRKDGGSGWLPARQMASPESPSSTSGTSARWVLSRVPRHGHHCAKGGKRESDWATEAHSAHAEDPWRFGSSNDMGFSGCRGLGSQDSGCFRCSASVRRIEHLTTSF
ncbi:MAG: hypothetical protein AAB534_01640 [Patescibacteria group bacterium]